MKIKDIIKFLFLFGLIVLIIMSCNNSIGNKKKIARLEYEFSGCFGYSKSILTVFKKDSNYTAELITDKEQMIEANLTKEQMEKFNDFVSELKILKEERGCTSYEDYTLYINNSKIKKADGSCKWQGFSKLQKTLFNKTE